MYVRLEEVFAMITSCKLLITFFLCACVCVCEKRGGGEQRIEMGVVLKFDMMLTKLA